MIKIKKNIIFAVGGTGGHVFPALALKNALASADSNLNFYFLGAHLEDNPYLKKTDAVIRSIASAPLGLSSYKIAWGVFQAIQQLKKIKPSLIVGFGSFYTLPILIAAKMLKYPFILHEQNAYPGRVTRLFAKSADFVAGHFLEAQDKLKGTFKQVHSPTFSQSALDINLPLKEGKKICVVLGGSLGASYFNQEMPTLLEKVIPKAQYQIVHVTGRSAVQDIPRIEKQYREAQIEACVTPFVEGMHALWKKTDCALCRSGGSTLFELMHHAIPSILIPYPYATDDHQFHNGRVMEKKAQGALLFRQKDVLSLEAEKKMTSFFQEDQVQSQMRTSLIEYKNTRNYQDLVALIAKKIV
jgi:UDP-N-acetylglucosamine--N-acetylmuramyl-(pentapeptide) pyrophosphoryl-undecaprenol N-acetylglucosamine transferase